MRWALAIMVLNCSEAAGITAAAAPSPAVWNCSALPASAWSRCVNVDTVCWVLTEAAWCFPLVDDSQLIGVPPHD